VQYSVERLSRRFGETWALREVSLEVRRGELFAVVGGDGAGKTTLMQTLCAILDPTEGRVSVAGLDSVADAAQHPAVWRRPAARLATPGYGAGAESARDGPRIAIARDRDRKISTTTGKERQAGFAEVDRNRGPIGRSESTSAALSSGSNSETRAPS